jgi:hypothetical protein
VPKLRSIGPPRQRQTLNILAAIIVGSRVVSLVDICGKPR